MVPLLCNAAPLPSVGELFLVDLLTFWAAGVSNAAFRFDEPLVVVDPGVLGTKPSSLQSFSISPIMNPLDYSHAEDIPIVPSISRSSMRSLLIRTSHMCLTPDLSL